MAEVTIVSDKYAVLIIRGQAYGDKDRMLHSNIDFHLKDCNVLTHKFTV